jgi:hypothetical protein
MKINGFMIISILMILASCSIEKSPSLNDELCSKSNQTGQTGFFFNVDKDSVNWEANLCGAKYSNTDASFMVYGGQMVNAQTGYQVVLRFSYSGGSDANACTGLQAEYNIVIGGDSGYMPYEIDSTWQDNHVQITRIESDVQIVEGQFTLRLKRKPQYENAGFDEYINLTNGTFKTTYCVCDY